MSVEAAKPVGALDSIKLHDTKRFRVRAVSNEGEIYERYFHKSVATKVSWIQLGTAAFTLMAQMAVMFILLDRYEYYNSGAYVGCGIWSAITIIVSSVMTMWAAQKPTYGKLHVSMALHIIGVIAQIILVVILFCSGIPGLRRSIRAIHRGEYGDFYGNYENIHVPHVPHVDVTVTRSSFVTDGTTTRTATASSMYYDNYYGRMRTQPTKEDLAFTLRQLNAAFVLNAMMSFAGIVQILMSFFMSLKTGRAICCGRTHLEGKFLEMEAVGREDADAVVNFRVGARERPSVTGGHGIVPTRADSVGPPPYDAAGLGFFEASAPQANGINNV